MANAVKILKRIIKYNQEKNARRSRSVFHNVSLETESTFCCLDVKYSGNRDHKSVFYPKVQFRSEHRYGHTVKEGCRSPTVVTVDGRGRGTG